MYWEVISNVNTFIFQIKLFYTSNFALLSLLFSFDFYMSNLGLI